MEKYNFISYISSDKCKFYSYYITHGCANIEQRMSDNFSELGPDDIPIIRGMWDNNIELLNHFNKIGQDYVYVDNGYFMKGPGKTNGYFRFVWNANQETRIFDCPSTRFDGLFKDNIHIRDWQCNERGPIIVTTPAPQPTKYWHLESWLDNTINRIKQFTDREIIVREKPVAGAKATTLSFLQCIESAYCVVTYNSMAAVEAVLFGIPVVVDKISTAAPMGVTDISKINNLVRPDRTKWMHSLAYGQWSLDEMYCTAKPWQEIIKRRPPNVKQDCDRI